MEDNAIKAAYSPYWVNTPSQQGFLISAHNSNSGKHFQIFFRYTYPGNNMYYRMGPKSDGGWEPWKHTSQGE